MDTPVNKIAALLVALALSSSVAMSADGDGGPPGNNRLKNFNIPSTKMDSSAYPVDHTQADMIGYISDNIDESLAEDIDDALNSDCLTLVQVLEGGSPGSSDATTIGVQCRKIPLYKSCVIMIHEYRHWLRARPACLLPGGHPETGDPETDPSDPCG